MNLVFTNSKNTDKTPFQISLQNSLQKHGMKSQQQSQQQSQQSQHSVTPFFARKSYSMLDALASEKCIPCGSKQQN
jgi:hypothetical protein